MPEQSPQAQEWPYFTFLSVPSLYMHKVDGGIMWRLVAVDTQTNHCTLQRRDSPSYYWIGTVQQLHDVFNFIGYS